MSSSQPVGLRYTNLQISVKEVKKDSTGKVVELVATCTNTSESVKPKGWIQWVANPLRIEVRLIEKL